MMLLDATLGQPFQFTGSFHAALVRQSARFVCWAMVGEHPGGGWRAFLILAFALLVLVGCQPIPQRASEYKQLGTLEMVADVGHAIVYVYRLTQTGTQSGPMDFYLNEQLVVTLPDETYSRLDLLPGHYRITAHLVGSASNGWLPPGGFEAPAGRAIVVYPVAVLDSTNETDWIPFLISAASIVISRGQVAAIPNSMQRTVTTERSRSWRISTEPDLDAFVDRMRRGKFLAPGRSSVPPLQNE